MRLQSPQLRGSLRWPPRLVQPLPLAPVLPPLVPVPLVLVLLPPVVGPLA